MATAADLRALVAQIYETPDGAAGCCLHVVTDDRNLDRRHVEAVLRWARESGHQLCIEAAEMMQTMSKSQLRRGTKLGA